MGSMEVTGPVSATFLRRNELRLMAVDVRADVKSIHLGRCK